MIKKNCILISVISFFICVNFGYSKDKIANYILDGSLVLYSPQVSKATSIWHKVLEKVTRGDYNNIISRCNFLIKERLSVNIFDPKGASVLGINYEGPVAYVNLKPNISYIIFTVKNKKLLTNVLDNLVNPIPYRLEGEYVIFSASWEILEYYDFKGIDKLAEFNTIKDVLQFNWDKNLIWLDSSYFSNKNIQSSSLMTMGDRMIGTFDMYKDDLIIDVFTKYNDPQVNNFIKKSMQVRKNQEMTILDYEFGTPAIVGQTYVNTLHFLDMIASIDQGDFLDITRIQFDLKKVGVDLTKTILPCLNGQLSYTVRNFDLLNKKVQFTISADIKNKLKIIEYLKEIVRILNLKGVSTIYKDLFTQQFYGWKLSDMTLWVGVVENNLIISSDEKNLFHLVENIYQQRSGFMNNLPTSFTRLKNNHIIGGQILFTNPSFIKNINIMDFIIPYDFMIALKSLEWDFYLINTPSVVGRRDVMIFKFYK